MYSCLIFHMEVYVIMFFLFLIVLISCIYNILYI